MMPRSQSAFSLVELLVVVAIVTLLAGVTITAIAPVNSARMLAKNGGDIASLIETARVHAMAKNTSVRVRFTTPPDKKETLVMEIYAQRPGESELPIQRKRFFENTAATFDPKIDAIGNSTEFVFNSRGELLDTGSIPLQKLAIQLNPNVGAGAPSSNIIITIAGLTGAVKVSQP